MFIKLKHMYDTEKIDKKYLIQAIRIGWITEAEMNLIIGVMSKASNSKAKK